MLNTLRRRAVRRRMSGALSAALIERSREPLFYSVLDVADTIDGRFDLLALHAWLVLERLAARGERALAQELVNGIFVHFDEALREQGAGDMGMSRRLTRMADAFYGRLKAYGEAQSGEALAAALLRNVYRANPARVEQAAALAMYVAAARRRLERADLLAGAVDFGPLRFETT